MFQIHNHVCNPAEETNLIVTEKLMTLGLTETEAEAQIVNGFLKQSILTGIVKCGVFLYFGRYRIIFSLNSSSASLQRYVFSSDLRASWLLPVRASRKALT